MSEIILSVDRLKKELGGRMIIKGISFDVRAGEIFGFLGPNGSGKTTTIRMLVDLIKPTEGRITLCGKDVQKEHDEALQYVGCIVENPELYAYMTGWQNLEHFAGMLKGVGEARIREVVEIVGLDQRIHDKVKTYSLGMRQRLGIAQALLGSPKLLILDEPTNGLDPQGIKEMRQFIRRLADSGLSVFVSSHLLSEIQLMCDRVAIILHGEVIAVGEVDALLKQHTSRVVWTIDRDSNGVDLIAEYAADETGASVTLLPERGAAAVAIAVADLAQIPEVNERLFAAGVKVFAVEPKQPTLEDLFLTLTGGNRID